MKQPANDFWGRFSENVTKVPALLDQPWDYTWQEFQRAFETACVDAYEAYWAHPDPALSPNPTITLPHSAFPRVTAMINPLTGDECPIIRISPFDWGHRR